MVYVKFKYRDEYSRGKWNVQECHVRSVKECKEIYGLDQCEHQILEVKGTEELNKNKKGLHNEKIILYLK